MILITGAGGKTGRAVASAAAGQGAEVRSMVRRLDQAEEAVSAGAKEVVTGDMGSQADLAKAMQGIDVVYHICPNVHPEEIAIGQVLIQAARQAGVRRLVYHSVLHPQVEAMPHHWKKMRVEELLFASGLDFTILQPAAYMQNTLGQLNSIRTQGIYYCPYQVGARLSMVDLRDVAEAAALVLTREGYSRGIFELCGAEALSQVEVANNFSKVLGKPVRAEEQDRGSWEAAARKTGMGDYAVNTLMNMFEYYDRHGLTGSPKVISCLLGRQPGNFEAFLRRTL